MKSYEFVILGCGVSGLCAAKLLRDAKKHNILMIDEYASPGGNQISREIGGFTYDIGAFYYWPTMPLFQMYPEVGQRCLIRDIKIERISPGGEVGPFPYSLQREFIDKGPVYWTRALTSLLRARLRSAPVRTAEEFAIFWMGKKLYVDLGLAAYISRFFGIPADQIEVEFARSRMKGVAQGGRLRFWLKHGYHSVRARVWRNGEAQKEILMVRPELGFPHMYEPAVDSLMKDGVEIRLGQKIQGIKKNGTSFEIHAGDEVIRVQNLVNTLPVKHICKHLGIAPGRDLECVSLLTLFVSFQGERKFAAPILYNWGKAGRWKRLTMHSDYYSRRSGREYMSIEVPLFRCCQIDPSALFEDFSQSVHQYGLFQGDLSLEGSELVDNAYPAHVMGATKKVQEAMAELRKRGVQSVGRQGRFDYLPTGEQVVKQVRQHLKV